MGIYTFDDGGSDSLLTRLADGYLAVLEPLLLTEGATPGERGPYLKTLRQLPVDPSEEIILNETAFSQLGALPAAFVVIGGGDAGGWQPDLVVWEQTVRVYLASSAPGRLVHGRLREAAEAFGRDPGIFTLWQHAGELLNDRRPLANSGAIRITAHAPVFAGPRYSLWVLNTAVRMQQDLYPSREAPLVDRMQANHQVPPGKPIATVIREF
jgi:hypothetical protein